MRRANFFGKDVDEMSTELRYVGIMSERGKTVSVDDAFYYAMWRVLSDDEVMQEFTEWFYSGNWLLKEVPVLRED